MRRVWRSTVGLVLVAVATVTAAPAASAVLTEDWQRRAGVELESVDRIGDDPVVTGNINRSGERHPALLVRRYDELGTRLWSRTWHPQATRVDGLDVTVDADGGVYVVGDIARANLEGGGYFLRKYSSAGVLRWNRISRGGFVNGPDVPEVATGVSVQGRRVIVVGHGYGCCGSAADDGWIRAFRTNGRPLWTRDFEVPGIDRRTNDVALDVATDSTGIYVVGHVETERRTDVSDRVDHELVVQKLRLTGVRIWTWVLRDRDVRDDDRGTDIDLGARGVFVVGDVNGRRFSQGSGFAARLSRSGDVRWRRRWGVPADGIKPAGVSVTDENSLVAVGWQGDPDDTTVDVFIRRIATSDGSLIEQAVDDGARSVAATGVTSLVDGAYVSGWAERADESHAGRLWHWTY